MQFPCSTQRKTGLEKTEVKFVYWLMFYFKSLYNLEADSAYLTYFSFVKGNTKISQYIDFSKHVRYLPAPNNLILGGISAAGRQCSALLSLCTPWNSTKATCSKRWLLTFHESGSNLKKWSQYLGTDSTQVCLENQDTVIKQFS